MEEDDVGQNHGEDDLDRGTQHHDERDVSAHGQSIDHPRTVDSEHDAPHSTGQKSHPEDPLDWSDRVGGWLITHRGAWATLVMAHFLILSFIAVGVLLVQRNSTDQIASLTKTAEDTNKIAQYLENCLVNRARLSQEEAQKQCGTQDTTKVVIALFNGVTCVLQLEVPARTEDAIRACAQRAIGGTQ